MNTVESVVAWPVVTLDKVTLGVLETGDKSAVVKFWDGFYQLAVHVRSDCDPKQFAKTLKGVIQLADKYQMGSLATEFIRQTGANVKATLVRDPYAVQSSYFYTVSVFDKPLMWNVEANLRNADKFSSLYAGNIRKFWEFMKNYRDPCDLNGRVVKFFYEGGSEMGNRIVKVDGLERSSGNVLLRGLDVAKEEYRSYRLDRIRGNLILVN